MCQSIAEGGKRCPVHQHQSVAIMKVARAVTNLSERQLEDLFRELRREGHDAFPGRDVAANTRRVIEEYATRYNLEQTVQKSLTLSDAQDEQPEAATLYAQRNLITRAINREQNLAAELASGAWLRGYSPAEWRVKYEAIAASVEVGKNRRTTDPRYSTGVAEMLSRRDLPSDPGSVVAWAELGEIPVSDREPYPYVQHRQFEIGRDTVDIGYAEGRLEIKEGTFQPVTAYHNIPEALAERILADANPVALIRQELRGNAMYTYRNRYEAERYATRFRCAACGQFRSERHDCSQLRLRAELAALGADETEIQAALREVLVDSGLAHHVVQTRHALPEVVSDRTDVALITDGTGETYLRVADHLGDLNQYQRRFDQQLRNRYILPSGLRPRRAEAAPFEVENMMTYVGLLRTTDVVSTPEDMASLVGALQVADIEIPINWRFLGRSSDYWESGSTTDSPQENYRVSGNIRYARVGEGEDPLDAPIRTRRLRCDCPDYREDYDCRHVRVVLDQRRVLLDASESENRVEHPNRVEHYLARHAVEIEFENDVNYEMRYQLRVDRPVTRATATTTVANGNYGQPSRASAITMRREALAERERQRIQQREEERQARLASEAEKVRLREKFVGYRKSMLERWKDIEQPYAADPERFHEVYRAAVRRKRAGETVIPFRTENVTDGICAPVEGARRFGVELEFDIDENLDRRQALENIGRELNEAGLTGSAVQQRYHAAESSDYAKWSFEEDMTVDAELVSPVMADTPEYWGQLQQAIEIIKRHGGIATTRTGSHVHMSTGSYEDSTAKHAELMRVVRDNSDTLYRLASSPERGKHRGMRWCAPNVRDSGGDVDEHARDYDYTLFDASNGHDVGLNFGNTFGSVERSNIEFRMWDGTLDAAVIQQQVVLSAAVTDYAERQVIEQKRSRRRRGAESTTVGKTRKVEKTIFTERGTKTHTQDTFQQVNGHVASFLDSILRRTEDRDAVMALFSVTKWQPKYKRDDDPYR